MFLFLATGSMCWHESIRSQVCLNKLTGVLQKMRIAPSARLFILGSMFELFELKVLKLARLRYL